MLEQRISNFEECLNMSKGIDSKYERIIRHAIPYVMRVEKAHLSDDINGIDYWVTFVSGRKIGVDTKVREDDWLKHHPFEDDIALETWSKIDRDERGNIIGGKVGWTRNTTKQTDWILFIWEETGRSFCLPFPWLCSIFTRNWEEWSKKYKRRSQFTKGLDGSRWESECVFVPRKLLWNALCKDFAGIYMDQENAA